MEEIIDKASSLKGGFSPEYILELAEPLTCGDYCKASTTKGIEKSYIFMIYLGVSEVHVMNSKKTTTNGRKLES